MTQKKTADTAPAAPYAAACKGKATGKGRAPAAPTVTPNRTLKAQASSVGATPTVRATVGKVRKGSADRLEAYSKKVHEVTVAGKWIITRRHINGTQASVSLADINGKVIREEKRSTADINAAFSFGEKLARLNAQKKELETERSVLIKAGEMERAEKNAQKLESNNAAYAAACAAAQVAGILEILPELAPRPRRGRHTSTVAPSRA